MGCPVNGPTLAQILTRPAALGAVLAPPSLISSPGGETRVGSLHYSAQGEQEALPDILPNCPENLMLLQQGEEIKFGAPQQENGQVIRPHFFILFLA